MKTHSIVSETQQWRDIHLFPDRSDIHVPNVASVTVLDKQIPLVRLDWWADRPVVNSDELSKSPNF